MKRVITYGIILLMAATYLLGTAGIGIYTCHCGHFNQPVILADACDCGQKHEKTSPCCRHKQKETCCSGKKSEKKDCCEVEYKSIDLDQEIVISQVSFKSFINSLFALPSFSTTTLFSLYDGASNTNYRPPPLIFDTSGLLFWLAQLRL